MEVTEDYFIDDVLQTESKAILQDLMVSTSLVKYFINFNQEKINKSILYIKEILKEFYKIDNLRVLLYYNEKTLYGYAISFLDQNEEYLYLHKIFVFEEYRKNGIGTILLNEICKSDFKITLICSSEKINFYTHQGFKFIKLFSVPNTDTFKLSKDLYKGLSLMSNDAKNTNGTIFLLDDIDIKNIANIMEA